MSHETGLTESIVAAAASRIGKTVLHLDANDYYGGQWASFNLDSIQSLIDSKSSNDCVIENAKHQWFVEESENQSTNESSDSNPNENNDVTANVVVWTKEKVMKDFRKFNIDLTPKVNLTFSRLIYNQNLFAKHSNCLHSVALCPRRSCGIVNFIEYMSLC